MKEIREFIQKHNTLTLATERNHDVFAAAVFYVPVNNCKSLLFVSNPKSDHITNLEYNSKCAVTIQENNLNWEKIKGIQIKGEVVNAKEEYWKSYLNVFDYISSNKTLKKAMEKVTLYELKINWVRLIDNSKGFGNKKEYGSS
ncbi:MAG: hypothetical protein BEU00_00180 [Marine Group III euryarchaeote CG-Epi3]|jgi:hypothetical protein|uniref:Pyridoxamine 5'-phosphate oxidase N-terminal domain-containing protein n=1 Tax=Marine Group III euryarchaeote CG-Epi3 TaxID=1888997 RepID=A0A1J5UCJ7_9ARCH|nr:MAG: hypothetical protein BEU00_00180 [Marine Group III euryarchaeote CG-Epi3]|tara:strand:+ start:5044 stop:5472 length:429 start_codon:yes stop_codon:yes gene_type:complete